MLTSLTNQRECHLRDTGDSKPGQNSPFTHKQSVLYTAIMLYLASLYQRQIMGKYELRPAVKKLYQLRLELSTPNMTSCVPQLVRNCISCIERYGCTKCPTIGRSYTVLLYFTLYTIICTHTELLNDIDNTVVISFYILMFIPYLKKSFRGRREARYFPNIAHFKLLF